jgi:hypothetical protein
MKKGSRRILIGQRIFIAWSRQLALVALLLATALSLRGYAQQVQIEVPISIRVDTTDPNVRAVYHLWKAYLNARPDSVYDNPYWSASEKSHYPNFDLAGKWMYRYSTGEVREWKPELLSVEKNGEFYELRTVFISPGEFDRTDRQQNIWGMMRVFAGQEKGAWKLFNAMPFVTRNYIRKTLGRFTFIESPAHLFNEILAKRTSQFADSVAKLFALILPEHIEFFVGNNQDELFDMIGVDCGLGGAEGFADQRNAQVFSGNGSEWYPHELTHVLFRQFDHCHIMLSEGIATYLGGSHKQTFRECLREANADLDSLPNISFKDLLEIRFRNGSTGLFYATGALFCHLANEKGGPAAVKLLLANGESNADLFARLEQVLGVKKEELDGYWKRELRKFR